MFTPYNSSPTKNLSRKHWQRSEAKMDEGREEARKANCPPDRVEHFARMYALIAG